jgi:hypothetical protein
MSNSKYKNVEVSKNQVVLSSRSFGEVLIVTKLQKGGSFRFFLLASVCGDENGLLVMDWKV